MKYDYNLEIKTPGFIRIRNGYFSTPTNILVTKDELKDVESFCKIMGYEYKATPVKKQEAKVEAQTKVTPKSKVTVTAKKVEKKEDKKTETKTEKKDTKTKK